jgi:hypothetical protein
MFFFVRKCLLLNKDIDSMKITLRDITISANLLEDAIQSSLLMLESVP